MKKSAFTLIELLIVVAIIAILAAIAVPNFMEAQVRAKVSRCKADMRTLATAIESYRVDNNGYPWYPDVVDHPFRGLTPATLSTPVAYISALPQDPYNPGLQNQYSAVTYPNPNYLFNFETRAQYNFRFGGTWDSGDGPGDRVEWCLYGVGPDLVTLLNGSDMHNNAGEYFISRPGAVGIDGWYDPTNGTKSRGDILRYGPGGGFEPLKTD